MGIDEITAVRLFRSVPRSRRAELARLADRITVPAGTVLARQDALAHEFFAIVEGLVEVSRDGEVVALLGAGDFFGEIALIGNPYRTATAVAVSDVDLVVIARREFRSMLTRFPEIAMTILAKATRRVVADLRATEAA
jgi:CRP/FNR family transcriptional regulator, cyclic AMP receptor protein